MKRLLIVAAHPDDEVLGCFATVAKLIRSGYEAFTLILGRGKSARGKVQQSELDQLEKEMNGANALIGIKKVFCEDFPDNMFDSVPLLEIVKAIEKVKLKTKPDIVITHHRGDINIDHRITYNAVMTATRPLVGETVKAVYSMYVPSSTEWNAYTKESMFVPNVFVDVSRTVDLKLKAMEKYSSELREYPHPRSLKYLKDFAAMCGARVGLEFCEPFMLVRKTVI